MMICFFNNGPFCFVDGDNSFLIIGLPYLNGEMWGFVIHKGEGGTTDSESAFPLYSHPSLAIIS